jgi:mRNA-degrading endonuclease toxin of MazEF toxin-antitoxin module
MIAGNEKECEVMIDQGRAIDNKGLISELGKVPPVILKEIKEKLRTLGGM